MLSLFFFVSISNNYFDYFTRKTLYRYLNSSLHIKHNIPPFNLYLEGIGRIIQEC